MSGDVMGLGLQATQSGNPKAKPRVSCRSTWLLSDFHAKHLSSFGSKGKQYPVQNLHCHPLQAAKARRCCEL